MSEVRPIVVLRIRAVIAKTGLSRSSLYKKVSEKTFPTPVALGRGARAVGWIESQVDHWLENLTVKTRTDEPTDGAIQGGFAPDQSGPPYHRRRLPNDAKVAERRERPNAGRN
jgi:prophage regulatory protein